MVALYLGELWDMGIEAGDGPDQRGDGLLEARVTLPGTSGNGETMMSDRCHISQPKWLYPASTSHHEVADAATETHTTYETPA